LSRGDLTDSEWRILDPLLPNRGGRGPAIADKRRTVNGILWVLRTGLARYSRTMRQLEFGLRALHALEQARSRGGFSTKIHLRTNAKDDPLTFDVTGGEAHEVKVVTR